MIQAKFGILNFQKVITPKKYKFLEVLPKVDKSHILFMYLVTFGILVDMSVEISGDGEILDAILN
jgi:hypothetical protein